MSTPVIFDLDGTLVDSAHGILASFAAAFEAVGLQPQRALDHSIIGPPLELTLRYLACSDNPALLARLAAAFKVHYDSQGYKLTRVFPGIPDLLEELASRQLFIATNKRHLPTQQLLDFLDLRHHFRATVSLDTLQPAAPNKASLIHHLMDRFALTADTLYVGDREDDAAAAATARIPFFRATWGYEGERLLTAHMGGDVSSLRKFLQMSGLARDALLPSSVDVTPIS